jgi:hypothetical protein
MGKILSTDICNIVKLGKVQGNIKIFQNESSTCGSTKSKNVVVDEELQKIIEKHNSKFLSQQSEYDLNGRRIRKTASPVKHAKVCMHPGHVSIFFFI